MTEKYWASKSVLKSIVSGPSAPEEDQGDADEIERDLKEINLSNYINLLEFTIF